MSLWDAIKDPKGALLKSKAAGKATDLEAERQKATPEERQRDYDLARQSVLGEFSSQPVSHCSGCLATAKAQRRQERLDLVSKSILSCPKHAKEAARLREDMDEVENMRCAKHVYLANDENAPDELRNNPPPGFLKPTKEQLASMGLSKNMLTPEETNFKAAVYMKDPKVWGENPDPPSVLAFRGSTTAQEDWDNNMAQGGDRDAPYYNNAVKIGNALRLSGSNTQIVGHSLGGGLASAAQGASGLNASTYNSAGLNKGTIERYQKADVADEFKHASADKITAIRVEGEVLTKTQESFFGSKGLSALSPSAVGVKRDLTPVHDEAYYKQLNPEKDDYDTYLHGMDEVIGSMESQKSADENALKACLAKGK